MCIRDRGKGVAGRRFAVIVDEAHSSTSGESVSKLKKVLGSAGEEYAALAAAEEEEGTAYAENADSAEAALWESCLLYTSPSPRDRTRSRMPSSA